MAQVRKHSQKREAILRCIRGTNTHPSADWIYNQLKDRIPGLSLGTVYRNLALFKESGEVVSLGVIGGIERFDSVTEPHVHFFCTRCGRVLDLAEIDVPLELGQQAANAMGARVQQCSLTFSGLCRECLSDL